MAFFRLESRLSASFGFQLLGEKAVRCIERIHALLKPLDLGNRIRGQLRIAAATLRCKLQPLNYIL